MIQKLPFFISSIHKAYWQGSSAEEVVREAYRRIGEVADPGIFIHLENEDDVLEQARSLGNFDPEAYPLWGIPYVIKDNIDAKGLTTTAGCPDYAYMAGEDALCVSKLREAGALLLGKTNLDQFATGLVGVRSPYAPPKNSFDASLIPGGSSSGSAVAVGHGFVSFSLGTDTAGSGRVPAALNNVVGLKPTPGAVSASGVVPACRSLDTVSIFALSVDDAYGVFQVVNAFDPGDAYSRSVNAPVLGDAPGSFTVGVPDQASREFYGDQYQEESFKSALVEIEKIGGEIRELDFRSFFDVADLLYEGAWVAERYAVVEELIRNKPEALHPTTREIISRAEGVSSADVFRDIYRLEALKRPAADLIRSVDVICVPTSPTYYTVDEVNANPIDTNSRLGLYTNFVNLLDMCGLAVPVGRRADNKPGSVTLLSSCGRDAALAALGRRLHANSNGGAGSTSWSLPDLSPSGAGLTDEEIELAVVGAHMSGLPLNTELTKLGGRFLRSSRTADGYRFYSLAGGPPMRPGLMKDAKGGKIELETWALPKRNFGAFMEGVPHPLGIGTVTLETGEQVKGFICEQSGIEGATEITSFGGWRNYLASSRKP